MKTMILAAAAWMLPLHAAAVSVSQADLPMTIQECVTNGSCLVNTSSGYASVNASAFRYTDSTTFETSWLMRYTLAPGSSSAGLEKLTDENTFPPEVVAFHDDRYTGHIWVQLASSYSLGNDFHTVTFFMDKVTPAATPPRVRDNVDDRADTLVLRLATEDLIGDASGNGAHLFQSLGNAALSEYHAVGYDGPGILQGETPLVCLADGCVASARVQLLQVRYATTVFDDTLRLSFNPGDARGLLYQEASGYLDSPFAGILFSQDTYLISPVPEPGNAWLFALGAPLIAARAWRRRAS